VPTGFDLSKFARVTKFWSRFFRTQSTVHSFCLTSPETGTLRRADNKPIRATTTMETDNGGGDD